jgi:hypothetical protein
MESNHGGESLSSGLFVTIASLEALALFEAAS